MPEKKPLLGIDVNLLMSKSNKPNGKHSFQTKKTLKNSKKNSSSLHAASAPTGNTEIK